MIITSQASALSTVGRHRNDRVVVDLEQKDRFLNELRQIGFTAVNVDNAALGLALVHISGEGQIPGESEIRAEMRRQAPAYGEPSDVDVLLAYMRAVFTRAGLILIAGKDRMLAEGTPYTGGGEGDPARAGVLKIKDPLPAPGGRIRVGMLDSGLFPHPELNGRVLAAPEGVLGRKAPDEGWVAPVGHAVHLAGLVAQQAPNAVLITRQVLDSTNEADSWALAAAMVEFIGEVDILLTAIGGATVDGDPPLLLERAEARLGCLHIASAGNWGNVGRTVPIPPYPSPTSESVIYPGALPGVVAVGALTDNHQPAPYSQPGSWVRAMALATRPSLYLEGDVQLVHKDEQGELVPTGKIETFDGSATWEGTSAAAAYFTGAVAAVAEACGMPPREAVELMLSDDPGPVVSALPAFVGIRPVA